jgi:hypothetical protein
MDVKFGVSFLMIVAGYMLLAPNKRERKVFFDEDREANAGIADTKKVKLSCNV